VKSADEFHKKLTLTGVVLTKMDGDARGGAALSIRNVTGQPIKFLGVGEKYDALEPFHPDRIVSRILGMGDILSLIEKAEEKIDKKKSRVREKGVERRRILAGRLPRSVAAGEEDGIVAEHCEYAAEHRAVRGDAEGGRQRG
jgi:signal recognition particle GTPase